MARHCEGGDVAQIGDRMYVITFKNEKIAKAAARKFSSKQLKGNMPSGLPRSLLGIDARRGRKVILASRLAIEPVYVAYRKYITGITHGFDPLGGFERIVFKDVETAKKVAEEFAVEKIAKQIAEKRPDRASMKWSAQLLLSPGVTARRGRAVIIHGYHTDICQGFRKKYGNKMISIQEWFPDKI